MTTTKEEQDLRNFVHKVEVLLASALAERDLASTQSTNHGIRWRVMWAAAGAMATAVAISCLLVVHHNFRLPEGLAEKVAEFQPIEPGASIEGNKADSARRWQELSKRQETETKKVVEEASRAPGELDAERARQGIKAKRDQEEHSTQEKTAEDLTGRPTDAAKKDLLAALQELTVNELASSLRFILPIKYTRSRQAEDLQAALDELGVRNPARARRYFSEQSAFEQGLGAYKAGYYEIAIPALEEVAARGVELNKFFAEFYLARIYSDDDSGFADHAKAYILPEVRRRQCRRRSRRWPAGTLRRQGPHCARRLLAGWRCRDRPAA
jgi:hypothetical protein